MAVVNSDLAAKQSSKRFDPILPRDFRGRVRVMAFEIVGDGSATNFIAGYLPGGEGRILGGQSSLGGDIDASTTITVGLGSYMPIKGGPVIALDEDALQAAKTLAESKFAESAGKGVTYSAANEVPVLVKTSVAIAEGKKLTGSILYVID